MKNFAAKTILRSAQRYPPAEAGERGAGGEILLSTFKILHSTFSVPLGLTLGHGWVYFPRGEKLQSPAYNHGTYLRRQSQETVHDGKS